MGDNLDELGLVRHEQSGNHTIGQVSVINQREVGEQAGALETTLERYYSGETNFNEVFAEIQALGYSSDRTRQIRSYAQTERTLRHSIGHPSDLAPNQLAFLSTRHSTILNQQFQIHQDTSTNPPRQYVDDARVREPDGTPARLYLPAREAYNPLTQRQQIEQERRIDEALPDFLQDVPPFVLPPLPGGQERTEEFSNADLATIDNLSGAYLASTDPNSLANLRENIDLFILSPGERGYNVRNADEIINQYLIDIQYEKNFRENNDGRPSVLSQEQYDLLRSHPEYQWGGGLIYENQNGELYYQDERRGNRVAVPNIDPETGEITQGILASNIRLPQSITIFTLQEDYDPTFNIRPSRSALSQADQERLQMDMADAISGRKGYDAFLGYLQNNYNLSNQQFIDVSNAVSRQNGGFTYQQVIQTQVYTDQTLYFYQEGDAGGYTFTTSPETYQAVQQRAGVSDDIINQQIQNFQTDFQVTHTAIKTSLTITPTINPELNILEQVRAGTQTQEQIDERFLERPRPFLPPLPPTPTPPLEPYTRPPRPGGPVIGDILQELSEGELSAETMAPDIFQPGSADPPIVPGQTIPNVGGEDQPVPLPAEQVERYREFFNSQQNQFTPFRSMFRDILPVFTGAAGGYFAFSLARSRERGTIQEIINQERQFLDALEARVEISLDRLDNIRNLNLQAETQRQTGYDLLERLNIARGNLAGMGDNPDIPEADLLRQVDLTSQQLTQSNQVLRNILDELNQATDNLDELQEEFNDVATSRLEVNNRLERILEFNREILNDINRYNPQILFGFSIGQTLGLALSGYFFPTYIDIDDDKQFLKADNINYNPDFIKKQKEDREKHKSRKPRPLKDLQAGKIVAGEHLPEISRRVQAPIRTFIPIRGSFASQAGRPLSYEQIQDYKSTLSKSELSKLQGKMLIFGENKKVYKEKNICKSVQGTNIINKIPIKI